MARRLMRYPNYLSFKMRQGNTIKSTIYPISTLILISIIKSAIALRKHRLYKVKL